MTAWIDPHAPRRPLLYSPGFRARRAATRFAGAAAKLAALALFVASLILACDALSHLN